MTHFDVFFAQKKSDVRKQRSAIKEILSGSPATITEISEKTQMSKDLILWNLMGMLRWGIVEISGENSCELIYALREV
jgi:predicted transcriptional regulator